MFVKILNEVADQINRDYPGRQHAHLFVAINIWCKKLDLNKNETDYINNISRGDEVTELGDYLDEEWKFNFLSRRSKLYDLEVWNAIKRKDENIKFTVLIAFAISAIGYFIYKLNNLFYNIYFIMINILHMRYRFQILRLCQTSRKHQNRQLYWLLL